MIVIKHNFTLQNNISTVPWGAAARASPEPGLLMQCTVCLQVILSSTQVPPPQYKGGWTQGYTVAQNAGPSPLQINLFRYAV